MSVLQELDRAPSPVEFGVKSGDSVVEDRVDVRWRRYVAAGVTAESVELLGQSRRSLVQRLDRFCGVEERQVGDPDEDRRVRRPCIPQSSPGRVPGNAESCACHLERPPPPSAVTIACRLDSACTLEAPK